MREFQDIVEHLDNVADGGGNKTPLSVRRLCKDASDFIVKEREQKHGLCLEIQRLRTALNQIAWPIHFNIEPRSLDVALCQKIAQDTLAITRPKCESRNKKETDGSSGGRTGTC